MYINLVGMWMEVAGPCGRAEMLTLAAARRHTWCVVNFLRTLTSAALVRDCSDELNVVTAAPRGKGYITVIRSPRTRFLTHRHSLSALSHKSD